MALPTTPYAPDADLPLATLDKQGKPPTHRLSSATEAQDLFWTLRDAAQPRLDRARIIQGAMDGNPPYNSAKQRAVAMAGRSNFNSLEAASRRDAAKTPFYDLFSSTSLYADCTTPETSDKVDAATASRVRSEHFDTLLRSYPAFDSIFNTMLDDFITFNKGFLWWPRPDSWHFEHLPWWRVYFPDGTGTNPDTWEVFAIEHRWDVGKLYRMAHAAGNSGWNVARVEDAIREAAPDDMAKAWNSPMELQRAFSAQELWLSAKLPKVQAASIYVKEFDGKWSRMMVEVCRTDEPSQRSGRAMSKADQPVQRGTPPYVRTSKEWLYRKDNIADSLWQIMAPFIFDEGTGSINELAGLGKRIISISQTKDRILNEQANMAMLQTGLVMQALTSGARAKMGMIQFGGGVTYLPEGYDVKQASVFGDLQNGLMFNADLDNRLDRNTGIYRPSFEKPKGNPESATAANIRYASSTVLTSSAVNRFYQQLDRFFDECYRRCSNYKLPRNSSKDEGVKSSVKFQKACEEAGLSEKQCSDRQPGAVRAQRAIGNGSALMRQQEVAALAQLVPFFGPRGLQEWKTMFVAAYGGQTAVNRLLPPEDVAQMPTRDDWDANQEDSDMAGGNQVVWMAEQDHEVHAKVHLTKGAAAIQAVQQGADPGLAFTYLQLAMPHIGQHIQKVPREQIRKQLEQAYMQVAQGAKQVMQAAQKAMEQQGQQSQLTFEQQLKMQQVQHDIQLKDAKTQAQMQQRAQKQTFDQQLASQQFQQDTQLKAQQAALADATTAGQIQRDTASTATSIKLQEAETAAKIANEKRKADAQAEAARNKPAAKE